MKPLVLRPLATGELDLANAIYAELSFLPSRPPSADGSGGSAGSTTFGGFEEHELVALGRITRHTDGVLELGGFWTRPDRRGGGIARAMVERVLHEVPSGAEAWCVPFTHLVDFYRSFGMQPVPDGDPIPESIEAHRRHCRELVCDGKLQQTELLRYRAE